MVGLDVWVLEFLDVGKSPTCDNLSEVGQYWKQPDRPISPVDTRRFDHVINGEDAR
jgi:hypothetical protein